MWNGQPSRALELVADLFVLHLPTPSPLVASTISTPSDVEHWVTMHRASFKRLVFDTNVGPFVDVSAGIVAGPWFAEAPTDDAERWVCGMDTIAFRAGKITEYWTLSKEVDQVGRWAHMLTP